MGFFDKIAAATAGGTEEEYKEFKKKHKAAKKLGLTVQQYDALLKQRESAVQAAQSSLIAVAQRRYVQLRESEKGPRQTQYRDDEVHVKVRSGYSRDYDEVTTDVIVISRDSSVKEHLHIIFGEDGREIYHEWRSDH